MQEEQFKAKALIGAEIGRANYSDRLNNEIQNLAERLSKLKQMQSMMQNNSELKDFVNTMSEIGYL